MLIQILILVIFVYAIANITLVAICLSLLGEVERLNKYILDIFDKQISELKEEISKNVFDEELE